MSVSNGIDLRRFNHVDNARELFLEEFNYEPDDFIVMGIGLYFRTERDSGFRGIGQAHATCQFISLVI